MYNTPKDTQMENEVLNTQQRDHKEHINQIIAKFKKNLKLIYIIKKKENTKKLWSHVSSVIKISANMSQTKTEKLVTKISEYDNIENKKLADVLVAISEEHQAYKFFKKHEGYLR